MSKKTRRCCICGNPLPKGDLGNNPEPIKPYSSGTCCNECNMNKVIPARLGKHPAGINPAIQARGDTNEQSL